MDGEPKKDLSLHSEREGDFSRLIANLTHELKTPLHSILAVASLLSSEVDGALNDEQKRQVEIIQRNGEHLLELITELLQFSSTATETRRPNFRQIKVRALFEEIVRSIEPLARKAKINLDVDLERLPAEFFSDPTLLRRIVGNLLSNALKFSPQGGAVSFYAAALNDGSLQIQIADSGIGMRPAVQQSIFAEFFQADTTDTRRFGGVGLGLALVKTALNVLGGTIQVQSELGKGSLFSLRIPSAGDSVQKSRILLIEPSEGIRLGLEQSLTAEGYETNSALASEQAVRSIAEQKPDLVILDVSEEEGRGFSLLEQVRGTVWGQTIPIIVMSTLDSPQERARGFRSGASDFIVKPFDMEELLARVRAQLERPW